jgi:hypothetical protein
LLYRLHFILYICPDIIDHGSEYPTFSSDLKKSAHQNTEKRIIALTTACSTFDHHDESRHNMELQCGAVNALAKLLSVVAGDDRTASSVSVHGGSSTTIRLVTVALEMIFRGASQASIFTTFTKAGWSQLMSDLLHLLELAEDGSLQHADVTILNLSKVLLHVSRVPDLRVALARQSGVLDFLTRVATSILNPDGRVTRLRILANLAYENDNKSLLFQHKYLLESVLRIAHLDLDDNAREYAGVVLMDLAFHADNQGAMAKNEKLVGTLIKMALVEKVESTRESAITAIQSLAYSKENRGRLVAFKDGIILEAMKKALNGDNHDKCRRRAAGALTNLICDETAEAMGRHKGLLDTLAIVSTKDNSPVVRNRASMALTKLAASITIRIKDCHSKLLDALVVASLGNLSISAVLRVKARDPENRSVMITHPGILDTLTDICSSHSSRCKSMALAGTAKSEMLKDKDNAMRALMHLSNDNKNRSRMCTSRVLDALVEGAKLPNGDPLQEDIRESAIRAIERLATEFDNRAVMARHAGLLVAVAIATEREAQLEAETSMTTTKKVDTSEFDSNDAEASSLAPSRQRQASLARPLLMSLLVAM